MTNHEPVSQRHFFTGDKNISRVLTQGFITEFKKSSLSPMQLHLEDSKRERALLSRPYFYRTSDSRDVQSLESVKDTKQLAVRETKSQRQLGERTPRSCAELSLETNTGPALQFKTCLRHPSATSGEDLG